MRFLDRTANALLFILGLGLIAMIGLSVYNVIARYVFSRSLLWADEVTVYAMIALAYLGAVVAAWRNIEIRMDILANLLPARILRPLHILQQATIALLCGWIVWQTLPYIQLARKIRMRSDASGLPLWPINAVIPVSLALIALIAAVRLGRLLLGREEHFVAAPQDGAAPP